MMYICAWQAAPLQPVAWISSMITAAADRRQPAAAIFLGDQGGEKAGLGQRGDELGRIFALAVERAANIRRKVGAQRAHRAADLGELLVGWCCGIGHLEPAWVTARRSYQRARTQILPRRRPRLNQILHCHCPRKRTIQ